MRYTLNLMLMCSILYPLEAQAQCRWGPVCYRLKFKVVTCESLSLDSAGYAVTIGTSNPNAWPIPCYPREKPGDPRIDEPLPDRFVYFSSAEKFCQQNLNRELEMFYGGNCSDSIIENEHGHPFNSDPRIWNLEDIEKSYKSEFEKKKTTNGSSQKTGN